MPQEAKNLEWELEQARSTLGQPVMRSASAWLACAPPGEVERFLEGLSDGALAALPYLFEFWALPHQLPPEGDWKSWVILGGRGAGKTRAGSEWVRAMVEGPTPDARGMARRVALVGETYDQALAVMVKGESGILACSPPDRRPRWVAGERMLIWPNGAEARLYSAHDPEALRGPQFDAAWADEIGCAAVDKGTNQPNKFYDPKSSESAFPHYSTGRRDDLIQAQYLRAVMDYWDAPDRNPVSPVYGGPMLDMDRAHIWAWDARPWPAFPRDMHRWSDGENWQRGHWLSGRIEAAPLDQVVAELCEAAGVTAYDVSELYGLVRGHVSGETESARARLQSLMLAHGFQAVEREGMLRFQPVPQVPDAEIVADETALSDEGEGRITEIRAADVETTGRVRLRYAAGESDYRDSIAEAVFPGDRSAGVSDSDLPMALTGPEAKATAERWLAEARVARDSIKFSLPPSCRALGAGALVALEDGSTWRVDRVEDRGARAIEAVRVEPSVFEPSDAVAEPVSVTEFVPPVPVSPVFMDLPLLTGEEVPHAPHLAVTAEPWPGSVAVYASPAPDGFQLNRMIERGAIAGTLETALGAAMPGLWDRGGPLRVRMASGALSSAELSAVLNGANVAAIGAGDGADWEVIQFAEATLVGSGLWDIGLRLRGQQGSDAVMPPTWPMGSLFVLLDGAAGQVELPSSARGLQRYWRIGPARRPVDDASYVEKALAFQGVGLRPYAPVHLRAKREGADRAVSWIRRTRVDGDSWEGVEVPLGEATEAYLLRVRDGAGVVRREENPTAPSFTYSAAMQAADGVSAPYQIEVAQMSERFGPGPFARIEIND